MLELNPELIITPSWDYSKKGDPEQFRQRILQNPAYKSIKAVKTAAYKACMTIIYTVLRNILLRLCRSWHMPLTEFS